MRAMESRTRFLKSAMDSSASSAICTHPGPGVLGRRQRDAEEAQAQFRGSDMRTNCQTGWSYLKACSGAWAVQVKPGSDFSKDWVINSMFCEQQGVPVFADALCIIVRSFACDRVRSRDGGRYAYRVQVHSAAGQVELQGDA